MPPLLDDPAAEAYLDRLVARLRSAIGDRLVAFSLINSAARDDYLSGRSDLDVAVAVQEPLGRAVATRLVDHLRHAALPCPAPRLELVVYPTAVLAAPGARPAFDLNLNTGPAIADHWSTDPDDEPPHWFVLDLAAARDAALPLAGPPVSELVGPMPDTIVLDALRASHAWHAAHDTVAPNRVLNLCRAWRWLEERRWSSKTEAVAWAIAAGADRALVEAALARRRGVSAESLPPERVAALASTVATRLDDATGVVEAATGERGT